jgi:hypothetical protein
MCALDSTGSGLHPISDPYKRGNEPSGFVKGLNFHDQLRKYLLFAKGPTPCS